ncbi:unnamed protein product [Lymnaea stagnalis]|uniref:Putative 2'-deoxynucleoside 5'-phosphate N-hydrolase 1 n=1 Tax=Lymnaea stagnalis TaxID=6523 RepID=A0AAV2IM51_LYMST
MSLNIYFSGSMRGGRQDVDIYYTIIEQLRNYGKILTEFVADKNETYEKVDDKTIHDKDVSMLEESHCIVAEVTQPSLGVGYEIGRAVAMKKPILCLYRPQEGRLLSGMIRGAHNGTTFIVIDYKVVSEVPDILSKFFSNLTSS